LPLNSRGTSRVLAFRLTNDDIEIVRHLTGTRLLDQPVGESEQRRWHDEAQRLRCSPSLGSKNNAGAFPNRWEGRGFESDQACGRIAYSAERLHVSVLVRRARDENAIRLYGARHGSFIIDTPGLFGWGAPRRAVVSPAR